MDRSKKRSRQRHSVEELAADNDLGEASAALVEWLGDASADEFCSAVRSAQWRSSELGRDPIPPEKGSGDAYRRWRVSCMRWRRNKLQPQQGAEQQRR